MGPSVLGLQVAASLLWSQMVFPLVFVSQSPLGLRPTHMTSFHPEDFSEGPVSKTTHMLSYCWLGLEQKSLCRGHRLVH